MNRVVGSRLADFASSPISDRTREETHADTRTQAGWEATSLSRNDMQTVVCLCEHPKLIARSCGTTPSFSLQGLTDRQVRAAVVGGGHPGPMPSLRRLVVVR